MQTFHLTQSNMREVKQCGSYVNKCIGQMQADVGAVVSINESRGYGSICTPYLWVQIQSVCANDPMPPDNQHRTLIQIRCASWVDSGAGIWWTFILFLAIFLPSFPSRSVFPLSSFACSRTKRRKCTKGFLAAQNQKAGNEFLTLTEAIGSHMRRCSHVISAMFVNGNP